MAVRYCGQMCFSIKMCQLVHGEGEMKDKYNLKNYLAHHCPESPADLKSIRLIDMQKKPELMEVWPISSLHCPLLRMTSFLDCWKNLTHAPWLQYRAKEASRPFRGAEMPLKSFVMRNDFYRWNKKCESTIRAFLCFTAPLKNSLDTAIFNTRMLAQPLFWRCGFQGLLSSHLRLYSWQKCVWLLLPI